MLIELKKVHYQIRGVPTERLRAFFNTESRRIGALTGDTDEILALVDIINAGAHVTHSKVEVINDPRQNRFTTGSEL